MKTQYSNALNLKVGDIISFTNSVNYKIIIKVSRVTDKSWYDENGGRNSFGSLLEYTKYPDFKIN